MAWHRRRMVFFLEIHTKNLEPDGKNHRLMVVMDHDCVDASTEGSFAAEVVVDSDVELVLR